MQLFSIIGYCSYYLDIHGFRFNNSNIFVMNDLIGLYWTFVFIEHEYFNPVLIPHSNFSYFHSWYSVALLLVLVCTFPTWTWVPATNLLDKWFLSCRRHLRTVETGSLRAIKQRHRGRCWKHCICVLKWIRILRWKCYQMLQTTIPRSTFGEILYSFF